VTAPHFIGLDLAWSERNRSGGAVLVAEEPGRVQLVAASGQLGSNSELLDFVAAYLPDGAPVVIGVDAPLWVPNETGRRRCDHEVSLAFRREEAGAYPGNRQLLAKEGSIRGERLAQALADRFGVETALPVPQCGAGRYLAEIFPHPAHIRLFGLPLTLKYKRKAGRSEAMLAAEFARYQQLLLGLATARPALDGHQTLCTTPFAPLRRRAQKALEDATDALTCAYVAAYIHYHGPAGQQIFGSVAEGHILVPVAPGVVGKESIPS
jgi:predicted RNase H-like nuclease